MIDRWMKKVTKVQKLWPLLGSFARIVSVIKSPKSKLVLICPTKQRKKSAVFSINRPTLKENKIIFIFQSIRTALSPDGHIERSIGIK